MEWFLLNFFISLEAEFLLTHSDKWLNDDSDYFEFNFFSKNESNAKVLIFNTFCIAF